MKQVETGSTITCIVAHEDYIFCGTREGNILHFDKDGKFINSFNGHSSHVSAVVAVADFLFSSSYDNTIIQWSIPTAQKIHTYTNHTMPVHTIFLYNTYLFSGSRDKTINQWDITNKNLIHTYTGHINIVSSVFVKDDYLFSGSYDKTVKQWNIKTKTLTHTFEFLNDVISIFVYKQYLFAGCYDGFIEEWDVNSRKHIKSYIDHTDNVNSLFVKNDVLYSGSYDYTVKQWSITSGNLLETIQDHTDSVNCVYVTDKYWYSGSSDKSISIYTLPEVEQTSKIRDIKAHTKIVTTLCVHGEYLFSGSKDNLIHQWNVSSGQLINTFQGHDSNILCITSYGNFILSGSRDNIIKRWNIVTGKLVSTYKYHTAPVISIVKSKQYLFSGSSNEIITWDISTNEKLAKMGISNTPSLSVSSLFAKDNLLFAGSRNGDIYVWNTELWTDLTQITEDSFEPTIMKGHVKNVTSMAAKEAFLFSASFDGSIKQWDITTMQVIKTWDFDFGINAIDVSNNSVLACCSNYILQIDVISNKVDKVITEHDSLSTLNATNKYVFVGSDKGVITQYGLPLINNASVDTEHILITSEDEEQNTQENNTTSISTTNSETIEEDETSNYSDEYSDDNSILDDNTHFTSRCSNVDPYTLENYSETDNDVFIIKILNSKGKFDKGECITHEIVNRMIDQNIDDILKYDEKNPAKSTPQNLMAIWTSPKDNNKAGYGGKPTAKLIFKLPSLRFYITIGSLRRIVQNRHIKEWYALPLYNKKRRRIGNVFGIVGMSMNHGQLPGEVVYKLFTKEEISKRILVTETKDDFSLTIPINGDDDIFTQFKILEKYNQFIYLILEDILLSGEPKIKYYI